MSSYLRSWLAPVVGPTVPSTTNAPASSSSEVPGPTINLSEPSPPASESGNDNVDEEDDDAPPPFPLPNSIQRSSGSSQPPSITMTLNTAPAASASTARQRSPSPDSKRMPPPRLPAVRLPTVSTNGLLVSNGATQRGTPNTISIPSTGGLALPPSTTKRMPNVNTKGKARAKVALAPGHGALDWANLKSSGVDLRGVTELQRVTPSMLKEHRSRDDAWSAFGGKVYNITSYLPYHPGGEKELMRVAGRDGTKLFATTHAWVNLDFMLDGCLVGFLVPEE